MIVTFFKQVLNFSRLSSSARYGRKYAASATTPLVHKIRLTSVKNFGKSNQWAAVHATTICAVPLSIGSSSAGLTLSCRNWDFYTSKAYQKTYRNSTFFGWCSMLSALRIWAGLMSVATTFLNVDANNLLHWPFPHPTSTHKSRGPSY